MPAQAADGERHDAAVTIAPPTTPPPGGAELVPRAVSRAKLHAELQQWQDNAQVYRRRGWLLLGVRDLTVDVGFITNVAVGDLALPVMTASARLSYDNYDLWPPSLTFIDPRTGEPAAPPVGAPDTVDGETRNVLLAHPDNGAPFLCLAGIREYHIHPQHTGDDWLLHRNDGDGRLAVICDRVWRRMARNVLGLTVNMQSLPKWGTQLQVGLAQGNVDLDLSAPANPAPP